MFCARKEVCNTNQQLRIVMQHQTTPGPFLRPFGSKRPFGASALRFLGQAKRQSRAKEGSLGLFLLKICAKSILFVSLHADYQKIHY